MNNATQPSLSVIIAARNELENLKKLIPKLLMQNYPYFEIIVGLDRCTDQSNDYLASIRDQRVKFVEIDQTQKGWDFKKNVLNEAIKKSNGEWIVFTDADCLPISYKWLEMLSKEISDDSDIIIGVSPYREDNRFLSHYIQFEAFMTYFFYSAMTIMKKSYMAVGRNLAIRKKFFLERNGYHDIKSVRGGDDDLFIQKNSHSGNTKLLIGKDSLIMTSPSESWEDYWKQKIRHFSVSKFYSSSYHSVLFIYHFIHLLFFLVLLFSSNTLYTLSILLFYLLIKWMSYRFVASKIGAGFNYILLPFVDIVYAFLTPVLGIWSKLEKDIEWKN